MSDKPEYTCPSCGNSYVGIAQHWSRSSSCDHPNLTAWQYEILDALMVCGATPHRQTEGSYPNLTVPTVNKPFLEWLDDEFGVLSRGVRMAADAETVREQFEALGGDTSNSDMNDYYEWSLRPHPALREYETDWVLNGEPAPRTIVPTPLIQSVIYARRGRLDTSSRGGGPTAQIQYGSPPLTADVATRLFAEYLPALIPHDEDSGYIQLHDSSGFFTQPGVEQLPGTEETWPDDPDRAASASSESVTRCPQCGGHYTAIANHWADSRVCTYPEVEADTREVIEGALLANGHIEERTDTTAYLTVETTHRPALEWLTDQFGVLATPVRALAGPEDTPEHYEWEVIDEGEWNTVYHFQSRNHPVFHEYWEGWYDESNTKHQPSPPPHLTQRVLQTLYVLNGYRSDDEQYYDCPAITVSRGAVTADQLLAAGAEFDPIHRTPETGESVIFRDGEAFFTAIGGVPASVGDRRGWTVR